MQWTWYLACDVQFFALVPILVAIYYHNRRNFWITIGLLWFASAAITTIVVLRNDFSASYFAFQDKYWTLLFEKPWARLPAYLVGVIAGCSYYSYKHEQAMAPGMIR
jgi:H+/Cl- antiporter ClcA